MNNKFTHFNICRYVDLSHNQLISLPDRGLTHPFIAPRLPSLTPSCHLELPIAVLAIFLTSILNYHNFEGFIQQKKLVELRLTNNKIFKVSCVETKLDSLTYIIEVTNVCSKVSNGTFDGLKTITILSLRKNFIEELGASVFTDLVRVEELDLGQVPPHHPPHDF